MKKVKYLVSACLIVSGIFFCAPVIAQMPAEQQSNRNYDNRNEARDGYVSPWIGLIGLVGLLGLVRKPSVVEKREVARERYDNPATRPATAR